MSSVLFWGGVCVADQGFSSELSLPGLEFCLLWASRIGKIPLEGEGMVSAGTGTETVK